MRTTHLLSLLPLLAFVSAAPSWHIPSVDEIAHQAVDSASSWVKGAVGVKQDAAIEQLKTASVNVEGIEYLSLTHPAFPQHRLRVVEPTLCDPNVKQLSGYLDISETRHLFFWFEESRHKPAEDPLVLWLNGGPGCSSTTGLLFGEYKLLATLTVELGGCNIVNEGHNVTYNKHSWNSVANTLFLDQPIGVGYSYADQGEVNNSPAAAEDVFAFLQLFIMNFKKYSKLDFHVAGESYAGTYIPNIADVIFKHNEALQLAPTPVLPQLNFKSVLIGNGLTNPYEQFGSVADWACDTTYGPYRENPEGPECTSLRAKGSRCQNLVSGCYKTGSKFACVPAALYCWSTFNELQNLGLNMYDARKTCDKAPEKDGPLCYKEMGWMETYLNQPEVKKASIKFQSCNMQINQNFLLQGDAMHNAGALLNPLVDAGIRVLIYSGEADMRKSKVKDSAYPVVNFIGCSKVAEALETKYSSTYEHASVKNFTDVNGKVTGWTKSAGKGAGNLAFVSFHNAGHMVPHDDPVAALTMFSRWLKNEPLA